MQGGVFQTCGYFLGIQPKYGRQLGSLSVKIFRSKNSEDGLMKLFQSQIQLLCQRPLTQQKNPGSVKKSKVPGNIV